MQMGFTYHCEYMKETYQKEKIVHNDTAQSLEDEWIFFPQFNIPEIDMEEAQW